MEAFVYCWTDHKTNKLYVGSHKGSIDDGYICSSKIMLEEYSNRPKDFSRQIVASGRYNDIRDLEFKILKAANASKDDTFYNLHNGASNFNISNEAIKKSVKTKRKKGWFDPEKNPMYGKRHSEEVKNEHSKRMSGAKNPNYGKQFSQETKEKMSIARKAYWDKKKDSV
jgi:hypothetical protein